MSTCMNCGEVSTYSENAYYTLRKVMSKILPKVVRDLVVGYTVGGSKAKHTKICPIHLAMGGEHNCDLRISRNQRKRNHRPQVQCSVRLFMPLCLTFHNKACKHKFLRDLLNIYNNAESDISTAVQPTVQTSKHWVPALPSYPCPMGTSHKHIKHMNMVLRMHSYARDLFHHNMRPHK